MTKIKEILQKLKEGNYLLSQEQLDTAASAIEKVHDEEMVGFAEWVNINCVRWGQSEWKHRFNNYTDTVTSAQLLHIYKNK